MYRLEYTKLKSYSQDIEGYSIFMGFMLYFYDKKDKYPRILLEFVYFNYQDFRV